MQRTQALEGGQRAEVVDRDGRGIGSASPALAIDDVDGPAAELADLLDHGRPALGRGEVHRDVRVVQVDADDPVTAIRRISAVARPIPDADPVMTTVRMTTPSGLGPTPLTGLVHPR